MRLNTLSCTALCVTLGARSVVKKCNITFSFYIHYSLYNEYIYTYTNLTHSLNVSFKCVCAQNKGNKHDVTPRLPRPPTLARFI